MKRKRTKGIPTRYAGVQFRSRLEARWAAFFDICEWRWDYEPIDLDGYIPDFLVDTPDTKQLLVEVKPALKLTDYQEAQATIDESEWSGEAATVGALVGAAYGGAMPGYSWLGMKRDVPGHWSPWDISPHNVITANWREAGNRVQWRGESAVQAPPTPPARVGDGERMSHSEVASFFGNLSHLLEEDQ